MEDAVDLGTGAGRGTVGEGGDDVDVHDGDQVAGLKKR